MTQKIIKVGNSVALTLPKEFVQEANLHEGDVMEVETNANLKVFFARPQNGGTKTSLTPEFKDWLDNFIKEYKPVLDELAHL